MAKEPLKTPRFSGAKAFAPVISQKKVSTNQTCFQSNRSGETVLAVVQGDGGQYKAAETEFRELWQKRPALDERGWARFPEVEIRLRDNARADEIRTLLLKVRGEIAGGPGQLGIYRITISKWECNRGCQESARIKHRGIDLCVGQNAMNWVLSRPRLIDFDFHNSRISWEDV